MNQNICKCSCHSNPLLFHIHSCCKHSGKIYIKDTGEIDMEAYNKLNPPIDDVCPCCGGTGKITAH